MCMTKNELINDIAAGLAAMLDQEQLDMVKAVFIVKMQGYDIHEANTLPAVEVRDNDFIFKRFAVDMLAKGLKESSIRSYMYMVRPFFEYTKLNYRDVTAQAVTDYLAARKVMANACGRRNTQTYIANICRVMFIFFQWAYRRHYIEQDIMCDVDRVRAKQKKKERITAEEIEACRECAQGDREKALLELMLSTGLRVGEIAALRIEDIDFHGRKVHVQEGKSYSAERDVYLSIRARNAVRRYAKDRKGGYMFQPSRNMDPDRKVGVGTIEKVAKQVGERAGVHCKTTVHVFRKTFASETYRRTGNVKLVSVLLGHASTEITEKYYLVDDLQDMEYHALYAA